MRHAKKAAEFAQEMGVPITLYLRDGGTVTSRVEHVGGVSVQLRSGTFPWARIRGWSLPLCRGGNVKLVSP